jgi:hypothetical protein
MDDIKTLAREILGHPGRMISYSKGQYRWDNPDNLVAFNANVCAMKDGVCAKVWHGDFDVTVSEAQLKKLAEASGCTIYLLSESDARFETENAPRLEYAVWCSSNPLCREDTKRGEDGRLYIERPEPEPKKEVLYDEGQFLLLGEYDKAFLTRSSKDKPPLSFFYEAVMPLINKDVKSLYMSFEAYGALKGACEGWLRRWQEYMSEYRIQSNLGWLMFEAPMRFENPVPWVKEYGIYRRVHYDR